MLYTSEINKALKLISEVHKNQVDKAGVAYILHPYEVANNVYNYLYYEMIHNSDFANLGTTIEIYIITALLHDVIEDTDITFTDLEKMGFNADVVEALHYLTHDRKDSYEDYIEKITKNKIATTVKFFDLQHNLELNRIDDYEVRDKICAKIHKYKRATEIIFSALHSYNIKNN